MREINFSDMVLKDRKKRIMLLQECFSSGGYLYTAQRRTICRVRDTHSFKTSDIANRWIVKKIADPNEFKRMSFSRICDDVSGRRLLTSKIAGIAYILRSKTVFTVSFIEILSVERDKREAA